MKTSKLDKDSVDRLITQFILFTPFFKPLSFEFIDSLKAINYLISIWRIASVALGAFFYFYLAKKRNINSRLYKLPISIFIFFIWFVLTSLVNGQNHIGGIISTCIKNVGFILILQYSFSNFKEKALQFLSILLQFNIIVNFIFKLVYPHGLAQSEYYGNFIHFLGNKNGISPIYIFSIVVIYCNYQLMYGKVTRKQSIKIILLSLSLIAFSSGTGIICSLLLVVIEFFGKSKVYNKLVNLKTVTITYVALLIVIVLLQMTTQFAWFFNLIGKDPTLTHRTEVWKLATTLLTESTSNFIVGLGFASEHGYLYYNGIYYTAHNMILEIMLRGGFIAVVLFVLIFLTVKKEFISMDKQHSDVISSMNAFLLIFLLNSLVEPLFTEIYLYGILCIGACTIIELSKHSNNDLLEMRGRC